MPQMMVFEGMEDLAEDDRLLFQEALSEAGATPDLDLVNNNQQRDLEIIAILSSVNTAVTVMVLGFLYMVGRPRSGAALTQYDVSNRTSGMLCRHTCRFR